MDESLLSNTTDYSITSNETEINSSYESQTSKETDLKNQIINSISSILDNIIKGNKVQAKNTKQDIFYLCFIPPFSLNDFIKYLMKNTNMEISTLIISIIYIDRFCYKNNYDLSYYNIYRLLLTSCLLSIKFNEDIKFDMKIYSDIAGVPIILLKQLEEIMFFYIDYRLYVNEEDYKSYYSFFLKTSNN